MFVMVGNNFSRLVLAAQGGNVEAQFIVGACYAQGEGVSEDAGLAVKWFKEAADNGHRKAQFNLAWCYANGKGVREDAGEAVKYYRLASDKGDSNASYNLGLCYAEGYGVRQNQKEADRLFQLANAQEGLQNDEQKEPGPNVAALQKSRGKMACGQCVIL
jgi:uncharacterized protein